MTPAQLAALIAEHHRAAQAMERTRALLASEARKTGSKHLDKAAATAAELVDGFAKLIQALEDCK